MWLTEGDYRKPHPNPYTYRKAYGARQVNFFTMWLSTISNSSSNKLEQT
jgi:hypothetical protein